MKKYILLSCLTFLTACLFAQGISFNEGAWASVLAEAKKDNKLVFVDVYTTWCGPCKLMTAKVFPQKEVGDLFNAEFVNYKIDAEKGEGITIAKQYSVQSFPTYLFVNGDGTVVYRSTGYNEPQAFLAEANIAIKEKNDPNPFEKWESEYNAGKRDKEFLMGYLKKRTAVKVPSGPILDELFPLLNSDDFKNKDFMSTIITFDPNMTFVPQGKFYKYLTTHYKQLDSLFGEEEGYTLQITDMGADKYFRSVIIANESEELLPAAMQTKRELMKLLKADDAEIKVKGLVMEYYSETRNPKKMVPAALDYVNNGILKLDINKKRAEDKKDYEAFRAPFVSGERDSTEVEGWSSLQPYVAHGRLIDISYDLRSAAEAVYKNVDDPAILSKAVEWVTLAEKYFLHFSTQAVHAALLAKLNKKQQAITILTNLSKDEQVIKSNKQKLYLENLEKIKKGELPEIIW